jgi:hypothetical protein
MQLSISEVDLGPCPGRAFDQGADGWVIILPGANYGPDAPLLWFAREAALASGRNVLAVWDTFDWASDPMLWVEERAEAAIRHADATRPPLIVAKSLTTLAAPLASRLALSAVWLTPLIHSAEAAVSKAVRAGLAANTAPSLLVGGTADAAWDGGKARTFPNAMVVEIADADHVLQVPGDPARSIEALRMVTAAVMRFLLGDERTSRIGRDPGPAG